MDFSVLMSVYKNEKVAFFKEAMNSVIDQTMPPEEIVLVRDGVVYQELQEAIDEYLSKYPSLFTYIPLEENGGLGNALRIGLAKCRNELVARMDTDDVCVCDRFEKQVACFEKNPRLDMVGGNIAEFTESIEQIIDYRCVPQTHDEIIERLKSRSPFNHQTVMFKKQSVLNVGNYETFYLFEDWYLWIRMFLGECIFENVQDVLVNVRITGMANRRGGMKYYKSCQNLLKYMLRNKVINRATYMKSNAVRFCGYVLFPNKLREWAYKKFLRNTDNTNSSVNEKTSQGVEINAGK